MTSKVSEAEIVYKRRHNISTLQQVQALLNEADFSFDEDWFTVNPPSHVVVAELEGKVIGSVAASPIYSRTAYIPWLVVKEEHRCNGVAIAMLHVLFRVLKSQGYTYFEATTTQDEPEVSFYTRMGLSLGSKAYIVEGDIEETQELIEDYHVNK